jgi:hypothetical protein
MTVVGERLVYELNGRSCLPLELVAPPRQGLTVSCSFSSSILVRRFTRAHCSGRNMGTDPYIGRVMALLLPKHGT